MDGDRLAEALEPEFGRIGQTHAVLTEMGIPGDVGAFSVPAEMLSESLCHAHEVRSRYTLLDWLWGQNLHGLGDPDVGETKRPLTWKSGSFRKRWHTC